MITEERENDEIEEETESKHRLALAEDCMHCEETGFVIHDDCDHRGEHRQTEQMCHCQLG